MNIRAILAAALLCVLTIHAADATSKHHRHHIPDSGKMVECSDPICEIFSVSPSLPTARARSRKTRRIPPGLSRVMAEGAGRVANMTCADVRAVVAIYGEWKAEATARAAGASEAQIQEGKRCLKSSSR